MTFELRIGDWTLNASSVFVRPHAYEDIVLDQYVVQGHRGHAQLEAEFRPAYALHAASLLRQLENTDHFSQNVVLRVPGEPTRTIYDATLMSYNWITPTGDGFASLTATWRFMDCDFSPVGLTLREQYTLRYPVPIAEGHRARIVRREPLQKLDWKKVGF